MIGIIDLRRELKNTWSSGAGLFPAGSELLLLLEGSHKILFHGLNRIYLLLYLYRLLLWMLRMLLLLGMCVLLRML